MNAMAIPMTLQAAALTPLASRRKHGNWFPVSNPLANTLRMSGETKRSSIGTRRPSSRSSVSEVDTRRQGSIWGSESVRFSDDSIFYRGRHYIGPTVGNRPNYKAKQEWEWPIYPHGVSKQNGKLRVQIKRKGSNPTYPSFPNTLEGVFEAAMFRDIETRRLWVAGILVRAPKFNFKHTIQQ